MVKDAAATAMISPAWGVCAGDGDHSYCAWLLHQEHGRPRQSGLDAQERLAVEAAPLSPRDERRLRRGQI